MHKTKSRKSKKKLLVSGAIQQNAYESDILKNIDYLEGGTLSPNMDHRIDEVISEIEEYRNPPTPVDQTKKNRQEILSNTPLSTKISQINSKMDIYGAKKELTKDFNFTAISAFIGNRVLHSTPVKKCLKKSKCSSSKLSSAKLIANIQEMRTDSESGDNWRAKKLFPKSSKISDIKFCTLTNEENISTNITRVNYNTGSCSVKVPKLGTYQNIVKKLTKLSEENGYDDKILAVAIRKLSKNQPMDEFLKNDSEMSVMLSNLAILLFNVEVERNPGAIITNNMFLDLVEEGACPFQDLPSLLPMAMKGAMKASKTLDKLLFVDLIKGCMGYDTSNKSYGINHRATKELVSRNKNIFKIWIERKGYDSMCITNDIYVQEIMKSMNVWLNFELRPFRLSEEDILSPFFRNNEREETEINSNADYSIVEDEPAIGDVEWLSSI